MEENQYEPNEFTRVRIEEVVENTLGSLRRITSGAPETLSKITCWFQAEFSTRAFGDICGAADNLPVRRVPAQKVRHSPTLAMDGEPRKKLRRTQRTTVNWANAIAAGASQPIHVEALIDLLQSEYRVVRRNNVAKAVQYRIDTGELVATNGSVRWVGGTRYERVPRGFWLPQLRTRAANPISISDLKEQLEELFPSYADKVSNAIRNSLESGWLLVQEENPNVVQFVEKVQSRRTA